MAYYDQKMEHKQYGIVKYAPVGFSWTTFFFGFFVPLIRADILWFFIMLIVALFFPFIGTAIIAFFYNEIYYTNLIKQGYDPVKDNIEKTNVVETDNEDDDEEDFDDDMEYKQIKLNGTVIGHGYVNTYGNYRKFYDFTPSEDYVSILGVYQHVTCNRERIGNIDYVVFPAKINKDVIEQEKSLGYKEVYERWGYRNNKLELIATSSR